MSTKQDMIKFIMAQQYWSDIWKQSVLQDWATGKAGSVDLDKLYDDFQQGNVMPIVNFIYVESGNNLQNPLWVKWGDTGISIDVEAIMNMITDLNNRLSQYQSVGGNNTTLISIITSEIESLTATLKQYEQAPGSNQ